MSKKCSVIVCVVRNKKKKKGNAAKTVKTKKKREYECMKRKEEIDVLHYRKVAAFAFCIAFSKNVTAKARLARFIRKAPRIFALGLRRPGMWDFHRRRGVCWFLSAFRIGTIGRALSIPIVAVVFVPCPLITNYQRWHPKRRILAQKACISLRLRPRATQALAQTLPAALQQERPVPGSTTTTGATTKSHMLLEESLSWPNTLKSRSCSDPTRGCPSSALFW